VRQAERRRFGRDVRAGRTRPVSAPGRRRWRTLVEPGYDRDPAADGRRLVAADLCIQRCRARRAGAALRAGRGRARGTRSGTSAGRIRCGRGTDPCTGLGRPLQPAARDRCHAVGGPGPGQSRE
jgi:hypothetical protein